MVANRRWGNTRVVAAKRRAALGHKVRDHDAEQAAGERHRRRRRRRSRARNARSKVTASRCHRFPPNLPHAFMEPTHGRSSSGEIGGEEKVTEGVRGGGSSG
uniref:Uncharacterized protein n=1 Tax=Arundo donax TaxID=35708 RepID=A0A0A9H4M6_ARUDO